MSPDARRWPGRGATADTIKSPLNDKAESSRAPSLFDDPPSRGPDTSQDAGHEHAVYRGRLKRNVLAAHQTHGPMTDDRLVQLFPDDHGPSVAKRRSELSAAGVLVDTGRRDRTRRGSWAVVWAIAEGDAS